MERINHILHNPAYRAHLKRTERREKKRRFCRHNLQHALDVARIAYILTLEARLDIPKDIVYAAALLHDIGKWMQLEQGVPHHESSAMLAVELLQAAGYAEPEIQMITGAILNHRTRNQPEGTFDDILYTADKRSRLCFDCKEFDRCDWSDEKKNRNLFL
jgi:uncharacterized protein